MSEREKLNLEINKPIEVTLLYDEPIISTNQYGEYIMYCLKNNEKEYVFFAPAEVHQELKNYGKGDSVIITKLAAQRGTKLITKYAARGSGKDYSDTSSYKILIRISTKILQWPKLWNRHS